MSDRWFWEIGKLGLIASLAVAGSRGAIAQIVPDSTLGNENSVVVPIDSQLEHIQGGALRGNNLFHSFQEFNVQNGHSAYFLNPAVVENIFSRVTGANVSEIFGTLGVLGEANLYLINPNGIIFGENASLDIQGSFVATTASSLLFGDGSEYSAVNPEIPGAIVNNVPIQISLQFEGEPAAIVNLANLSTGESLTLAGGNLDLEGELVAGEDLTLTAEDTVKIRDGESDRFVAAAGNDLLIQGNEKVDIFALNHEESGLFSSGDMVLRSNNAVIGDAHYYSGGNFRIERLDGSLGDLESPNDPILLIHGDVRLNSYEGNSLHILAGGSVEITDYVEIQGSDNIAISPILTPGLSEVTLSDGTSLTVDGTSEPTLDIRVGIDWQQLLGGSPGNIGFGNIPSVAFLGNATSADITLGTVIFGERYNYSVAGRVLLTNQYYPNTNLAGDIHLNATESDRWDIAINNRDESSRGGVVDIDSRGGVFVDGVIDTSVIDNYGDGGNITILADEDITINNGGLRTGDDYGDYSITGGEINLMANQNVIIQDSFILTNEGDPLGFTASVGGKINIVAGNNISIENSEVITSDENFEGADINLEANNNIEITNSYLSTIAFDVVPTSSGNINILSGQEISIIDTSIYTTGWGFADAGNIKIDAASLNLLDSYIDSSSYDGSDSTKGGNIEINLDNIALIDNTIIGNEYAAISIGNIILNAQSINFNQSKILAPVPSIFDGGVFITAEQVTLSNNSVIKTTPEIGGQLFSGNIEITADRLNLVNNSGIQTDYLGSFQGSPGEIRINSDFIALEKNSFFSSESTILRSFSGYSIHDYSAGNILIKGRNLREVLSLEIRDNSYISTNFNDNVIWEYDSTSDLTPYINEIEEHYSLFPPIAVGGDINIITDRLNLDEQSTISAIIEIRKKPVIVVDTSGIEGTDIYSFEEICGDCFRYRSGAITIEANNITLNRGGTIAASSNSKTGQGISGNIILQTNSLSMRDGSQVSTETFGTSTAGNISLNNAEFLSLSNSIITTAINSDAVVDPLPGEQGGNINLQGETIILEENSQITASTSGQGDAGEVKILQANSLSLNNSTISTEVNQNAMGNGGNIILQTETLSLNNNAQISAATEGEGNSGEVNILEANSLSLNNNSIISTEVNQNATGNGGDIFLQTDNLFLNNNAQISAATEGQGKAGNLNITAHTLEANNGSQLRTNTITSNDAGDITLNIANNVRLTGNDTGLFAQTQGAGDAGDILVNTPELNLLQGATIRASTSDRGNSGDITVNAPNSIFLGGNSQLSVETSNAGKAGNITLTTPNLTVEELARITATATATATTQQQGGSITVNASQMNLAGTVGIFAETQGQVPAGILTLQPDNNQNNLDINFQQGAQISASTSGSGTGGSLFVFAPDTIDISGDGTLAVETSSTGNAGNIEMRAANLNLSNGAKISASTSGEGQGGNIDLAIARHIQLSDRSTGIIASTAADSRGNGGNINIQTAYLNAADGVEIGVNSQGMGTGGDIDITADRINLNNSQITAETRSTQGGNINLTVRDLLLMRHGSKISTTAGTAQAGGDGGNITINAENGFLVGPTGEDNDITANAFEGNGGNINITAQEIFGLKFRDELTPRSDITASSEFGLDGIVQLNTLGIDPNNGLTNLPEDQNDPEVRQGCSQGGANSSSLTVQGIGGAPDNPDDMLTPEIDDEFISLDELETDGTIAENEIALLDEKRSPLAFSCQ
ncbi:MAG: filamentous hemagglutinin N-terminal domain-containing protein [Cyanobacteria bacterium SBLK]|nr:filamentous hemagglutinin N-terminal domain-containing protein [Cyanobacteria bacterium SBLK]